MGTIAAGLPETADRDGSSPRFDEEQMARFLGLGRSRTMAHGDVLFAEGDAGTDFFVIESGSVAVVQGHGRENRVIAVFGPGAEVIEAVHSRRPPMIPAAAALRR
jgi:CRP-like cAMP-binding protein